MPRLTAQSLQLYSTVPGRGAAANEISAAVTAARKTLRAAKPRTVSEAARLIGSLFYDQIGPVLTKHAHTGARDTEPRYVVAQALVTEAKAILGIDYYCPELADAI